MLRQPNRKFSVFPSAAVTGSSTSTVQLPEGDFGSVTYKLTCSQASGTSPTLDVYLQTTDDGGTTFYDMAHFVQLSASGANPEWVTIGAEDASAYHGTVGDATISASAVGIPHLSKTLRVKYTVAGTSPQFTFAVVANLNSQTGNGS